MANILTSNARIEQYKVKLTKSLWMTLDNLLIEFDNGKIGIVPRYFLTDNITFINSDFADVRASHFHDVGCKYKQVIYVDLALDEIINKGYLVKKQVNNFNSTICKDIPIKYLYTEDVSFNEINDMFYEILISSKKDIIKSKIMRFAVNFNISFAFKKRKKIDLSKMYFSTW